RLSVAMAFQLAQHGESVPVKLWREGREVALSLPVYRYDGDRATGNQHGTLPRYFIYGGLVFTPLSLDYLRTLGRNWSDPANGDLNFELFYRPHESPETVRPEPIVMASVLTDAVNADLHVKGRALVDKINGVRIERLEDVIRAFETATGRFDLIEFTSHSSFDCLDREAVRQANARLLETYGITQDRRL
ncbi:MAG TPA: serine protease, partial [Methylomirabilota bacterium]|nr:serine protease [Methylomirabilota bacterium]